MDDRPWTKSFVLYYKANCIQYIEYNTFILKTTPLH